MSANLFFLLTSDTQWISLTQNDSTINPATVFNAVTMETCIQVRIE